MIIYNESSFNLSIIIDRLKFDLGRGKTAEINLTNKLNEINVYINYKSNIRFNLFPAFRASHFLEDHIILNLVFNSSLIVTKECKELTFTDCACKCDVPINLISVSLSDYSAIERVSFFSPSYDKLKRKFLLAESIFIFLLPLWILGCALGVILKENKMLTFSFIGLLLSLFESYKLFKAVNTLSETDMVNLLKQRTQLIEQLKFKDSMSQKVIRKFLNRM